jgi:predicted O-methyltransferase YrrM
MPLDSKFLKAVGPLYMPGMGTESIAPLLYTLIRAVRPQRVLEIGLGYTTPFILQALSENIADFKSEAKSMIAKTEAYKANRRRLRAGKAESASVAAAARASWMDSDPPLADPAYYSAEYTPVLYAFENFSDESSASMVSSVVKKLQLSALLRVFPEDFRGASQKVTPNGALLDFVWLDCGGYDEYLAFLDEYWDVISRKNGLLVMHYTLNNPFIGHIVNRLKLKQATSQFTDFELLSLLEPHKFRQNSFTILRKCADFVEDLDCSNRILRQLEQ